MVILNTLVLILYCCTNYFTLGALIQHTYIYYLTVSMHQSRHSWAGCSLLKTSQCFSQGLGRAVLYSEAWGSLLGLSGCWQNSLPCSCRTEVPFSWWLSAKNWTLEASHTSLPLDLKIWGLFTLRSVGESGKFWILL